MLILVTPPGVSEIGPETDPEVVVIDCTVIIARMDAVEAVTVAVDVVEGTVHAYEVVLGTKVIDPHVVDKAFRFAFVSAAVRVT